MLKTKFANEDENNPTYSLLMCSNNDQNDV